MFDIGFSELLVLAVVAILVVGPKDLPRMLRTTGRLMGQVRRTANDFRRQFDDALREAEREADLGETTEALNAIGSANPIADIRNELKSAVTGDDTSSTKPSAPANDSRKADSAVPSNEGPSTPSDATAAAPPQKKDSDETAAAGGTNAA